MCLLVVEQPEVYENPLFMAALDSVTSGLLTTSQAAEKFGIRESAVIAAVSWSDVNPRLVTVSTSAAVPVCTSSLQVACCSVVTRALLLLTVMLTDACRGIGLT